MHVRCPQCHGPIEVLAGSSFTEINCPSCGSTFSLTGGDTTATHYTQVRRLAHFDMVRELGIGRFGSVWMARDTKLDRTVAIKIPRKGALDAQETEFFLRDARAAAQLNHPGIVSVHEIGRDDDTLYIVSDYVEGANLKEWLTGQRLSFRESAELVVKVADALHHAHEAGVVHRDLKPGNIMLDVDGQPHIIDFGLARRDTGEVTMTVEGHILGTPAYMSPEQAKGKGHDADRRSDVYSLGVILFELLTGELPFRGEAQMLLLQIQRDEPPRPRRLNSKIPHDLQTITLKCLEKDPGKRYATARALADDLRRWLKQEPIVARPVGRASRAWRWCKRNRAVAALTAVVILALATGMGVSSYFAVRAIAERDRAEEASRQARQAVNDSFTTISESKLVNVPGLQPLRKALLQDALRYYDGFLRSQGNDSSLRAEFASTHYRVGHIRYILGELTESEQSYRRASEMYSMLARENRTVSQYQSRVAGSYSELALIESATGRLTKAEASERKAMGICEHLVREHPAKAQYWAQLAGSHNNVAKLMRDTGRLAEADASNSNAIEIYSRLARENPRLLEYKSALASCYDNLANLRRDTGKLSEAEASNRQALKIYAQLARDNPAVPDYGSTLARCYRDLATLQTDTGRLSDAEASNAKSLEIYEKLARENPAVPQYETELAFTYTNLANVRLPDRPGQLIQQRDTRRLSEAEASYGKAVEIQQKLLRENPTVLKFRDDLASTYTNLGNLQGMSGRVAEAEASYGKAVEIQEKLARENPAVLRFRSNLAFNYTNLGNLRRIARRLAEAQAAYEKALAIREKLAWENPAVPEYESELAWSYNRLAAAQQLAGRSADAEQSYRQAIAHWESQSANGMDASVQPRALGTLYSQLAKQMAMGRHSWDVVSEAMIKASSLAPRSAWVHAACGDAAALSGRWSEAAHEYARAEEAADRSWHMIFLRGMLELVAGNNTAYRTACRDLINLHGQNENQNVSLAILFVCGLGEDAVDDWEPIINRAEKIIAGESSNPLPYVGLGSALYLAGRPAEATKVLTSIMPQHALAMLVVPDKQDAILQSQLMGETYLALAYHDLARHEEATRARQRAEHIIARMEKASPVYDEILVLWSNRYAAAISKRKLALFLDSKPLTPDASSSSPDSDPGP